MLPYSLKHKKIQKLKSKIPKAIRTKNGRIMLLSKFGLCDLNYQNLAKGMKPVDE